MFPTLLSGAIGPSLEGRWAPQTKQELNVHTAALLVDFENYYVGERKKRNADQDAMEEFASTIQQDMQSLMAHARELAGGADLRIARAYADFQEGIGRDGRRMRLRDELNEIGFDTRDVPGKFKLNSAENQLIVDAIELQFGNSELRTFVLVGSDCDLRPLVISLKSRGARVVVIGFGNARFTYRAVADQFVYLEELKDLEEIRRSLMVEERKEELAKHTKEIAERLKPILLPDQEVRLGAIVQFLEAVHPLEYSAFGYVNAEQFFRDQGTKVGLEVRRRGREHYLFRLPKPVSQERIDAADLAREYIGILTRIDSNKRTRPVWVALEDWNEITGYVFRELVRAAEAQDPLSLVEIKGMLKAESILGSSSDSQTVDDVFYQIRDSRCLVIAKGSRRGEPARHANQAVKTPETIGDIDSFREAVQIHMVRKLDRELHRLGESPAHIEALLVMFTSTAESWTASDYARVERVVQAART